MSSEEELPPEAREVIDVARRARTPNDAQRDRSYAALLAGLAGGGALGTAKVAGKATLIWLKWLVPTALVAAAGAGTYAWHTLHQPSVVASAHTVQQPARPPLAVPTTVAPPESSAPLVASDAPAPSAAPSVKQALPKPSSDDLVQELSLLHQALAASRSGNAASALDLARQHAQRYPNSRLRNECDAIEVRSLCSLGRAPEAKKIADRMRARAPNSPVSAALQDTCVGK